MLRNSFKKGVLLLAFISMWCCHMLNAVTIDDINADLVKDKNSSKLKNLDWQSAGVNATVETTLKSNSIVVSWTGSNTIPLGKRYFYQVRKNKQTGNPSLNDWLTKSGGYWLGSKLIEATGTSADMQLEDFDVEPLPDGDDWDYNYNLVCIVADDTSGEVITAEVYSCVEQDPIPHPDRIDDGILYVVVDDVDHNYRENYPDKVRLFWDKNSIAEGYTLYQKVNGDWQILASLPAKQISICKDTNRCYYDINTIDYIPGPNGYPSIGDNHDFCVTIKYDNINVGEENVGTAESVDLGTHLIGGRIGITADNSSPTMAVGGDNIIHFSWLPVKDAIAYEIGYTSSTVVNDADPSFRVLTDDLELGQDGRYHVWYNFDDYTGMDIRAAIKALSKEQTQQDYTQITNPPSVDVSLISDIKCNAKNTDFTVNGSLLEFPSGTTKNLAKGIKVAWFDPDFFIGDDRTKTVNITELEPDKYKLYRSLNGYDNWHVAAEVNAADILVDDKGYLGMADMKKPASWGDIDNYIYFLTAVWQGEEGSIIETNDTQYVDAADFNDLIKRTGEPCINTSAYSIDFKRLEAGGDALYRAMIKVDYVNGSATEGITEKFYLCDNNGNVIKNDSGEDLAVGTVGKGVLFSYGFGDFTQTNNSITSHKIKIVATADKQGGTSNTLESDLIDFADTGWQDIEDASFSACENLRFFKCHPTALILQWDNVIDCDGIDIFVDNQLKVENFDGSSELYEFSLSYVSGKDNLDVGIKPFWLKNGVKMYQTKIVDLGSNTSIAWFGKISNPKINFVNSYTNYNSVRVGYDFFKMYGLVGPADGYLALEIERIYGADKQRCVIPIYDDEGKKVKIYDDTRMIGEYSQDLRFIDPKSGYLAVIRQAFENYLDLDGQSFSLAESSKTYKYRVRFIGKHPVTKVESRLDSWSPEK